MEEVLCRPWVEEIEDYKEYKRLRQFVKTKEAEAVRSEVNGLSKTSDGACDIDEVDAVASTSDESSRDGLEDIQVLRTRDVRLQRVLSRGTRHKDLEDDCTRSDSMFD